MPRPLAGRKAQGHWCPDAVVRGCGVKLPTDDNPLVPVCDSRAEQKGIESGVGGHAVRPASRYGTCGRQRLVSFGCTIRFQLATTL